MKEKHTYKELKQRVKYLEILARKEIKAEEKFHMGKIFFETLLYSSPVFFCAVSLEYKSLMINEAMLKALCYTADEVIGKDFLSTICPETERTSYKKYFRLIINKSKSVVHENHVMAKDGHMIIVEWHGTPVFKSNGKIDFFFGLGIDITERKKVEDDLKKTEQRLTDFIDFLPDPTMAINLEGKITTWNKAMEEMTGVKTEDILGQRDFTYAIPFYGKPRPIMIDILLNPDLESQKKYSVTRGDNNTIIAEAEADIAGKHVWLWGKGSKLFDHKGNVIGAIESIRDITEHKITENALKSSEECYRLLAENINDVIWVLDMDLRIEYISPSVERTFGFIAEEMKGCLLDQYLTTSSYHKVVDTLSNWLKFTENGNYSSHSRPITLELEMLCKDGSTKWTEVTARIILDNQGDASRIIGTTRDITERRNAEAEKIKLEERLRQSEKLESIGQLAGGVAHDFNNILSPIMGYAEMLSSDLPKDSELREDLREIVTAAERARDLTRQLLAFARKQTLFIKQLSLNHVITNFQKMLRRTIHENIKIELKLMANPDTIAADVGQMEQIMLNLAINAQDAMPEGGILTIETSSVKLDAENLPGTYMIEGNYVRWQIRDTGAGMNKETMKMIFEPFFTTKGLGKGTGLGLSTVYGIVKQHKGYITVDSQSGNGTVFNIYLPQKDVIEQITDNEIKEEKLKITATKETILLAEDDSTTRKIISLMLKKMKYSVLQAEDGKKALEIALNHQGKIGLLITDVIMPEINGAKLFEQLKLVHPDIRVIFISGYAPDEILRNKLIEENVNFIQKPFTMEDLQKMVQNVLDTKEIR